MRSPQVDAAAGGLREEVTHVGGQRVVGRLALRAHGEAHQRGGVGVLPVFGHALAVGHAAQHHLMANQRVQRRAELDGLVHLGEHHAVQRAGLERGEHLVECVALRAGVEHQGFLDLGNVEHVQHVLDALVALAQAGGVDDDQALVGQQVEQVLERGAVVCEMRHHAEHAAEGAQLLEAGDAVGVERDHADAGGAVLLHALGGQLGGGGGLADAGGTDQRDHAAFVAQASAGGGDLEVAGDHVHQPAHRFGGAGVGGHALEHGARHRGRVAGADHLEHQVGLDRVLLGRAQPGQRVEALLDHVLEPMYSALI
eukprot:Opistho-1_new@88255